ncbi:hypothetical protein MOO44_00545 (plasmid) [Nicoliella spurrieriana]|uniref:Uncharacterized protein n=1 Tax=Nicoliella spurrieriana TaxID=2925830 RepID=A0A976RQS6_9LACO|nr:hypothetical protein [Nicoliella spurrieriana]UQS86165.1 hypothetical protein MOO44_00545 [Nicoliella spurrieriana]
MKLQMKINGQLVPKITEDFDFNIPNENPALTIMTYNYLIIVVTEDDDYANDLICDIVPNLMSLSPTYHYRDFYTLMDVDLVDGVIYFQSDGENLIESDIEKLTSLTESFLG